MFGVLFSAPRSDWETYQDVLPAALAQADIDAEIEHSLTPDAPETVDYIVYAPSSRLKDFKPFSGAKAVLNLWAGVEAVVGNQTLTQPLARMVDPGLTEGMVEWCVGHVMRHHLGLDLDFGAARWRLAAKGAAAGARSTCDRPRPRRFGGGRRHGRGATWLSGHGVEPNGEKPASHAMPVRRYGFGPRVAGC